MHRKVVRIILVIFIALSFAGAVEASNKTFYIEIKSDKDTVLKNALSIVKEHYFIVSTYHKGDGKLTAKREVDTAMVKELWFRIVGSIDHELVLDCEVIEKDKIVNFSLTPSIQYTRNTFFLPIFKSPPKDIEPTKLPLKEGTPTFSEVQEILVEVKNKSESK